MATQDEYMITITLSPLFTNEKTMKEQLKKTYNAISPRTVAPVSNGALCPITHGRGCVEITLNGNLHYHIKTRTPLYIIQAFLDSLKLHKFKDRNGKRQSVFGFTKVDKTKTTIQSDDYKYIVKDSDKTAQAFKRAGISSDYYTIWDYSEKAPKAVNTLSKVVKHKIFTIKNTPLTDSDTELFLSI